MKQLFFFFLFIFGSLTIVSAQDFSQIDQKVLSYPKYTKPDRLAARINQDFQDDFSKARAAFRWLTQNIRYDLEEYYQPRKVIQFRYQTEQERLEKLLAIKDNLVKEAFLTKMGVCEEYAQSFKKLADLLGIESEVIKGYVRNSAYNIGRIPQTTNHVWNAVKINNRWVLLDATWAAGYLFNGKWVKDYNEYFFAIDPKKIGLTHYPEARKWQLILEHGSLEDFYNQPIYSQGFLRKDIEVLSPQKGNILIDKSKKIVLRLKNFSPSDRLFYNYRGQKYSKQPQITFQGKTATVAIENPGVDTELYLFLNRGLALEYRVFVR
jgi:transglutaminase/protease-like cytokinesis protein 3